MNIAMADNCSLKFCGELKEHWIEQGHEVRYETGSSEILAQWADIYWIDWWDNNIVYLFNWYKDNPKAKKPKFIVRAIDIDIWHRGIRNQEIVDFVDHVVCIAPHMQEWLLKEKDDATGQPIVWGKKLVMIRPGVNTLKFIPKTKETNGYNVGMVLGDMWWYKNHMVGLDIFSQLAHENPKWHLHIRGQHEPGQYNPVMYEHFLDSRHIRDQVTLYGYQEDMNQWYENIDMLLHPGMKEAYCYAVAEAMSKGIKVVCNEFYGSRDIWPNYILYKTTQEAAVKLRANQGNYTIAFENFTYIREHHNIRKMFKEIDDLMFNLFADMI